METKEKKIIKDFKTLGDLNASPDTACYPIGSCTMKYNPRINDYGATLEGFQRAHPKAPLSDVQGTLEMMYYNQEFFKRITRMDGITTQPVAGAHGELVGLKLFLAYHKERKENRKVIFILKSAHGTNPATAASVGFETVLKPYEKPREKGICFLESNENGEVDFEAFEKQVAFFGREVFGIMITNPNTLGIFESRFSDIAKKIHDVGGLVYMDGANMNAIALWFDFKKMGVDAMHNNMHKTWSIPHGGGGPGDAFVAVNEKLVDYLPSVGVVKVLDHASKKPRYEFRRASKSIGSFHRHFGNVAHKVRAYAYVKSLGEEGIRQMSAVSVLCANYLRKKISKHYPLLPRETKNIVRMHEFIITLPQNIFESIMALGFSKPQIVKLVGKLFLDFGFHAPTVSFPEPYGFMIEPTESYSKAELDRLALVIVEMKHLLLKHPSILKTVPHFTPVSLVDEVSANRKLVLSEQLIELPSISKSEYNTAFLEKLYKKPVEKISKEIIKAHHKRCKVDDLAK